MNIINVFVGWCPVDGPHGGGDGSILELGHHQVHLSLCLGVRLGRVQHPDSGPQLPRDSTIHSQKIQDAVCCFFISHWSYNQSIKVDEIIRSHCDILAKVNKSGLKCLTYSLHKLPDSVYTIHAYIFIINTLWHMKFWKILIHVQEPVRLDHIYR